MEDDDSESVSEVSYVSSQDQIKALEKRVLDLSQDLYCERKKRRIAENEVTSLTEKFNNCKKAAKLFQNTISENFASPGKLIYLLYFLLYSNNATVDLLYFFILFFRSHSSCCRQFSIHCFAT